MWVTHHSQQQVLSKLLAFTSFKLLLADKTSIKVDIIGGVHLRSKTHFIPWFIVPVLGKKSGETLRWEWVVSSSLLRWGVRVTHTLLATYSLCEKWLTVFLAAVLWQWLWYGLVIKWVPWTKYLSAVKEERMRIITLCSQVQENSTLPMLIVIV